MIILLAVLGILVSTPIVLENMDPAPVASNIVNKPTVNYSPAPVVKSKFLTDVERLGLTEYFNSITEKFKEIAKSKGINDIFVKWDEKENAKRVKQTATEVATYIKTKEKEEKEIGDEILLLFIESSKAFIIGFAPYSGSGEAYLEPEQFVNISNKVSSKLKTVYAHFNKQTLVDPHYINEQKHNFIYFLWSYFLIENNKKILSPQFCSLDRKYGRKYVQMRVRPLPEPLSIPELNELFIVNNEFSRKLLSLAVSHISTSKIPIGHYVVMCVQEHLRTR